MTASGPRLRLARPRAGQVREIPVEQARGTVHPFAVAEPAKARRRAIKHTKVINDRFDKATLCLREARPSLKKLCFQSSSRFNVPMRFPGVFFPHVLYPRQLTPTGCPRRETEQAPVEADVDGLPCDPFAATAVDGRRHTVETW
jgi:hypothetical protein